MCKSFTIICDKCGNKTSTNWSEYKNSRLIVLGEQHYDETRISISCDCGNEFEIGSDFIV